MNNEKNAPDLRDIEGKKLSTLLKNLEILENHIFMNARISYDTAFGSLTSIVLIAIYAYINEQFLLFAAIPFIISLGGMIYLHMMRLDIEYDAYGMKIEDKINKLLKSNVISQIHDLGVFSETVNPLSYMKLVIPFALGYIVSAYFGGKSIVADKGEIVGFIFLIAFILMAIFLMRDGYNLKQTYDKFYRDLFPAKKSEIK